MKQFICSGSLPWEANQISHDGALSGLTELWVRLQWGANIDGDNTEGGAVCRVLELRFKFWPRCEACHKVDRKIYGGGGGLFDMTKVGVSQCNVIPLFPQYYPDPCFRS